MSLFGLRYHGQISARAHWGAGAAISATMYATLSASDATTNRQQFKNSLRSLASRCESAYHWQSDLYWDQDHGVCYSVIIENMWNPLGCPNLREAPPLVAYTKAPVRVLRKADVYVEQLEIASNGIYGSCCRRSVIIWMGLIPFFWFTHPSGHGDTCGDGKGVEGFNR
ncbi:hypothetical protein TTRE_0000755701 [Trichuris trichiura]|uniref:Uncharacterized protein n=1 Tax=Trichuris trichiura TaxID=36087 RepID=A0A077ZFR9_TRITR|nr:hypothetical protein TTRE_0000755701 [Trichuris trichiura]